MQKLASVFSLISDSISLVRSRAKTIYSIFAVTYLVILLPIFIFGVMSNSISEVTLNSGMGGIVFFVLIIVAVLIGIWVQLALYNSIIFGTGFKESFKQGEGKVLSYIWLSIITGLIVLIGFILLIIPGILFLVWFSFAPVILVAEGLKGKQALSKSKSYVKGYFASVLGRLFVLGLIALIISFAGTLLPKTFENIFNIVFGFIAGPIGVAFDYLLYKNLKEIKEPLQIPTPAIPQ